MPFNKILTKKQLDALSKYRKLAWTKKKKHTEESKQKMSKSSKGKVSWIKGKHHTEETKKRIANTLRKIGHHPPKMEKEKHPLWKGGISFEKGYKASITKRRRARKKGNGGFHTIKEWEDLKNIYNFTCPCCFKKEPEIKLTEDHILPLLMGGSDNIENIQPLCRSCNAKKNKKFIKYPIIS